MYFLQLSNVIHHWPNRAILSDCIAYKPTCHVTWLSITYITAPIIGILCSDNPPDLNLSICVQ
jgi:hypothetical protein